MTLEQHEQEALVHVPRQDELVPISIEEITGKVAQVKEIMKALMKPNEHYGVPFDTEGRKKQKPSLYKPGAELLGLAFELRPEYETERFDLPGGHREYEIKCRLYHRPTDRLISEGVGCNSTMNGKYRFRTTNTCAPVPKEYWKTRSKDALGGPQYSVKKVWNKDTKKNDWVIMEKVEHDNPADHYNTVKKMAKKSAFVDAIITACAAGELFTQDLEDMTDLPGDMGPAPPPRERQPEQREQRPPPQYEQEQPSREQHDDSELPPPEEATYNGPPGGPSDGQKKRTFTHEEMNPGLEKGKFTLLAVGNTYTKRGTLGRTKTGFQMDFDKDRKQWYKYNLTHHEASELADKILALPADKVQGKTVAEVGQIDCKIIEQ